MKDYKKPLCETHTALYALEHMGPSQTSYGIQVEIWRTGRLNQLNAAKYEIVRMVEYKKADITNRTV